MTETLTQERWQALRSSVSQTADRLADLVTAAPDPTARATRSQTPSGGTWSAVDTAVHVATVAALHHGALRPDENTLAVPGLGEVLDSATVDSIAALNDLVMGHVPERDPQAVANRVRAETATLLQASENLDPDSTIHWLGGSQVPVAGILAHLLNELCIHGRDIARATGAPWVIPPTDAATFFELFVVGMVCSDYGRLLDTPGPPRPGRITVHFRSKYTTPVTMVLDHGRVRVEDTAGPVDVRITYDPTMFNLMMFGRVSKARAVLTGKVVVGGRRPWLLPAFLQTVRMPG